MCINVERCNYKCMLKLLHLVAKQGGIYIPGDGVVSAPDAALAMGRKARDLGTW